MAYSRVLGANGVLMGYSRGTRGVLKARWQTGTEACVHYLLEGVMGLFLIHWDNPFASRCDYFTKSPDP